MTPTMQPEQEDSDDEVAWTLSTASGRRRWPSLICRILWCTVGVPFYVGSSIWLPICLDLLTLYICDKISPLEHAGTRVNRLLEGHWLHDWAMMSIFLSTAGLVGIGMIAITNGYCCGPERMNKKVKRNPRSADEEGDVETPPPYRLGC